jgi:hypothetical protein
MSHSIVEDCKPAGNYRIRRFPKSVLAALEVLSLTPDAWWAVSKRLRRWNRSPVIFGLDLRSRLLKDGLATFGESDLFPTTPARTTHYAAAKVEITRKGLLLLAVKTPVRGCVVEQKVEEGWPSTRIRIPSGQTFDFLDADTLLVLKAAPGAPVELHTALEPDGPFLNFFSRPQEKCGQGDHVLDAPLICCACGWSVCYDCAVAHPSIRNEGGEGARPSCRRCAGLG